jgi:hypothetical protein
MQTCAQECECTSLLLCIVVVVVVVIIIVWQGSCGWGLLEQHD